MSVLGLGLVLVLVLNNAKSEEPSRTKVEKSWSHGIHLFSGGGLSTPFTRWLDFHFGGQEDTGP
eukprot:scaffold46993_cov21-Cyclotella_meneghiniana.AAC.1